MAPQSPPAALGKRAHRYSWVSPLCPPRQKTVTTFIRPGVATCTDVRSCPSLYETTQQHQGRLGQPHTRRPAPGVGRPRAAGWLGWGVQAFPTEAEDASRESRPLRVFPGASAAWSPPGEAGCQGARSPRERGSVTTETSAQAGEAAVFSFLRRRRQLEHGRGVYARSPRIQNLLFSPL